MKKGLVVILALVLMLGVAGTAFADNYSNPWVEVPVGNWAYDAIAKLIKDGIVESDSKTSNTLTRYELAKIVAKAMAHEEKASAEDKTMINRLSLEFSNELQTLNVSVENLEKKVNKVSFGGVLILKYDHQTEGTSPNWMFNGGNPHTYTPMQVEGDKFVLAATYNVSNIWTIQTMGEYTRDFQVTRGGADTNFSGLTPGNHDDTKGMWVAGNLSGLHMNLGRFPYKDATYGFVLDEFVSGAQFIFGTPAGPGPGPGGPPSGGVSATLNFGKLDEGVNLMNYRGIPSYYSFVFGIAPYAQDDLLFANSAPGIQSADITYPLSKNTNLTADYIHLTSSDDSTSSKAFAVGGFDTKLDKNFSVKGVYSKSNYSTDNKGYMLGLTYKAAIPFIPHSWDIYVNLTHAEANSTISTVDYDIEDCVYGAKGITVGYEYIPRPGVIYMARYIYMTGLTPGFTDYKNKFIRVAAIIPIF